jgi:hypothetical protein
MHLRRAVLLMALVLGVVALVEALVPVPRERRGGEPAVRPQLAEPSPRAGAALRTIRLRYPSPRRVPRLRVAAGAHLVLEVATSTAGLASVARLDLVQAAEPGTPASFDVLIAQPGTYAVAFDPAVGGSAVVGRLAVAAP